MSEHLGILSIAFIWSLIIWVLTKWPVDKSMTISKHVARHDLSKRVFALGLPVGIGLFVYFLAIQFTERLELSGVYSLGLLLVGLLYVIAAHLPDEPGGNKQLVHGIAAYGGYYILNLFMFALIFETEGLSRAIAAACTAFMLYVSLRLSPIKQGPHDLYYQLVSIAVFDVGVLALYYIA